MRTTCTECNSAFEIQPKTQRLEDVDVVYVECPECESRWLSYVADKEIRKRIKRVSRTKAKMTEKAQKERQRYIEKTRQLQEQKKKEYEDIIKKVVA